MERKVNGRGRSEENKDKKRIEKRSNGERK